MRLGAHVTVKLDWRHKLVHGVVNYLDETGFEVKLNSGSYDGAPWLWCSWSSVVRLSVGVK